MPRPKPKHGTISRYNNQRCRCDKCRRAATDYKRAQRGQAPKPWGPTVPHGTTTRYQRWGCRCAACKEASRLAMAAWRAKKREEADAA